MALIASAIGALAVVAGLLLSGLIDSPSGPSIVVMAEGLALRLDVGRAADQLEAMGEQACLIFGLVTGRHTGSVPVFPVGGVVIGGDAPIIVQSMTNTDTADIEGTALQAAALAQAGSELVRITVDREESAAAVPHIRDRLDQMGVATPLIGDFHYNGHTLLAAHPACAAALAKYRINPGNVGFKEKRDRNFWQMIEIAIKRDRPVRIGVELGFARSGAARRVDG